MKQLFIISVFIYIFTPNNAQHTIWKTNGKRILTSEYTANNGLISYLNNKSRSKKINIDDVFAVVDESGEETLFYSPDSKNGDYSVSEMRSYLNGVFDGLSNYKCNWAILGGMIAAVPIIFTTIPYAIYVVLIKPKESKFIIPAEYANDSFYVEGYRKGAKKKVIENSIKGVVITYSAIATYVVTGVAILAISGGYDM